MSWQHNFLSICELLFIIFSTVYLINACIVNCFISHLAPSAVQNLHAVETEPRRVTLTWNSPQITNGIITAYVVEYQGRKSDLVSQFMFLVPYQYVLYICNLEYECELGS